MKLFGKLLIAVLIIGILLPFTVLKGKDGKPLMNFSSLKMPDLGLPDMPELPSLPNSESVGNIAGIGDGETIIYQWKDSSGNIQFTNSPPPQGVEYTVKGYDPDANVIQSVKFPDEQIDAEETPGQEDKLPTDAEGVASVYSPERVNKLIDDAKNVEKLLNDRLKQQNAIIGD